MVDRGGKYPRQGLKAAPTLAENLPEPVNDERRTGLGDWETVSARIGWSRTQAEAGKGFSG